jgi:hypothetical protein
VCSSSSAAKSTETGTTGNLFRNTGHKWHLNLSTTGLSKGTSELIAILYDGSPNSSKHSVFIDPR